MTRMFSISLFALSIFVGAAACSSTARGVVQDTKDNTAAVRGGLETVDVKSAIMADKSIDSGAIDVDTQALEKGNARVGDDAGVVVQLHVPPTHQRIGQRDPENSREMVVAGTR